MKKVIIYTKTMCPWAIEAMDFLKEHDIAFEERDVIKHPEFLAEVEAKSGQNMSPTLDIDGVIVPDAGVEDIAKALGIEYSAT